MKKNAKAEIDIVCVDDEKYIVESIKDYLDSSFHCFAFDNPVTAIEHLRTRNTDILIVDYRMPEINGLDLLKQAFSCHAYSSGILLTAYADKDLLKNVINEGLVEFVLEKPLDLEELSIKINELGVKILADRDLRAERQRINDIYRLLSEDDFDFNFIGKDGDLKELWNQAVQVAPTDENILITGDTGTGKDVVAKQIHMHSHRASKPFIKINCGAIPAQLIESELFGHEKGAFSGAEKKKHGKIELAHKGSLFLDEIGELPIDLQSRLLHVVEDKALERIGGTEKIRVDFRLITATNKKLDKIPADEFRRDLFYRISTVHIKLPPLCERKHDLPVLILSTINKISRKYGKTEPALEPDALKLLCEASWPGNIRELENVFKRVLMMKQPGESVLAVRDFMRYCVDQEYENDGYDFIPAIADQILNKKLRFNLMEQEILEAVLLKCGGRVMEASRRSGIPKDRFYRMQEKKL